MSTLSARHQVQDLVSDQPERRNAVALAEAWRRGLRSLFVLPYDTPYVQKRSSFALEMAMSIYLDDAAFSEVLNQFGSQ